METITDIIRTDTIPLDYAYSSMASVIDSGIRDTIKGIRLSILAMGIGLARIRENRLFMDLKFRSMNKYIEQLCAETRMERSSIFDWLSIGEAYLKYRNDLEEIGFNDSDGPSKLLYINRALETNQKQEVFSNIKSMSVREFKTFSRTEADTEPGKEKKVTVRGSEVYIGNRQAITLNNELNKQVYSYFRKVILVAGKALEEGGVILPVRLRNMNEARRLERSIPSLIKKIRAG